MTTDNPYAPKAKVQVEEVEVEVKQNTSVPTGTVSELLEYVDGDKEKARAVLSEEQTHNNPRKSLVAALEDILKEDK